MIQVASFHEIVGGLVVVAFIVMTILAAFEAAGHGGRQWTRQRRSLPRRCCSCSTCLASVLLGNGVRNSTEHYVIALLILVPVAFQHTVGAATLDADARHGSSLIWSLAAAFPASSPT